MNKILYKRLDHIFTTNNVFTGGNFAGLSGGSCDTPIAVLESILHDAKLNNSPLFLFFLDISKAFDTIDRHALQLALERIRLPRTFISLISNLFGYRHNTIITTHGTLY
jgi:hypothetical protein